VSVALVWRVEREREKERGGGGIGRKDEE